MATLSTSTVQVLGPAEISVGAVGAEVSLGHTTDDGIEVIWEPVWSDPVTADQFGETPLNHYLIAEKISVKAMFTQFENDVLSQLVPTATVDTAGSPPFTVGGEVGDSALDSAQRVRIRPFRETTAVKDIVLYKAFAMTGFTLPVQFKTQAKMEVTFVGLLDTSRPDGNRLWGIGDDEL